MTITSILSVFGAGFVASLSPCVYPIIPISVGYLGKFSEQKNGRLKAFSLFILGHTLLLIILGYLAIKMGESFGFASQDPRVQIGSGLLLIVFSLFSLFKKMPGLADRLNQRTQGLPVQKLGSFLAPFSIGATTALMTSPCSTPILASVLTLLATRGSLAEGVMLMVVYSIGFLSIFSLLALGISKSSRLPKAGLWMTHVHTFTSWIMLGTGVYFIFSGLYA